MNPLKCFFFPFQPKIALVVAEMKTADVASGQKSGNAIEQRVTCQRTVKSHATFVEKEYVCK